MDRFRIRHIAGTGLNGVLAKVGLRVVDRHAMSLLDWMRSEATAIPLPPHELSDGWVQVRPLLPRDAPAIASDSNDRDVATWVGLSPYSVEDAQRWIETRQVARQLGQELELALVDPKTDRFAGCLGLHRFDWATGRVEMWFWLSPEGRGRGLMTHAVRLVSMWVFASLPVNRVELVTRTDNTRARALAVRSGFREEGVLRDCLVREPYKYDAVLFSLLRSERLAAAA
jgi:RimJ/RimL family protein N-acetyltransferase